MTSEDPTKDSVTAPVPSPTRRRWMRLIIGLVAVNVVVFGGILYYLVGAREAIEAIPTTSIPSLARDPAPVTPVAPSTTIPAGSTVPTDPGAAAAEEEIGRAHV